MDIKIKCTQEQKEKIQKSLASFENEIIWEIIEMGSITDEELNAYATFTEREKEIIKKMYSEYPKGFFPNPRCALY